MDFSNIWFLGTIGYGQIPAIPFVCGSVIILNMNKIELLFMMMETI